MLCVNSAKHWCQSLHSKTDAKRTLYFYIQHLLVKQEPLASPTKAILDKYGSAHLNTGMIFNKIISSHLILIDCLRKCMDMHEHYSAIH